MNEEVFRVSGHHWFEWRNMKIQWLSVVVSEEVCEVSETLVVFKDVSAEVRGVRGIFCVEIDL